ncbi:MFS transporter (putative signal transducer) [Enterobacter sp. BIGb0383]|uniref:MFS transporter n=1 Tax=unclassified Enterobacter TaxID=2608935 RepID=UPI000F4972D3|nr:MULTISPECIES: MFS transporter [unclassified Enterobacter]ROP62747.1 MFS transporter (putative signal transducer) [Enterobacter sp. BIGb0383]ROS12908.1 MFS transporter (putative signal transducer) [Enterobacter sp. BIGb0359]
MNDQHLFASVPVRITLGRVLFAVTGIYITQTMISTLAMQSVPALVRAAGGSLALIGATTLFMLPWALKILWAPTIERWRLPAGSQKRRSRPLILGGQMALAGLLLLAALTGYLNRAHPFQSDELFWLFGLLMAAGLVAATLDIACDGFCVDQLSDGGYGWGNVAQVGGSYLGMMLGGGAFLLLAARYGWPFAAAGLAVMIVVFSLPMWRTAEPARSQPVAHRPSLGNALSRRSTWFGLLLIVGLNAGVRVVMPLSAPVLLDHGLDMASLGWLLGGGSIAAGLVGTLGGGLLIHSLGQWRALYCAFVLQAIILLTIALCLWLLPAGSALPVLMGLTVAQFIVTACSMVCVYAVLMGLSSPLQAGVDFTLFQCADAGIAILGGTVGGVLAQYSGYSGSFFCAAGLTVMALVGLRIAHSIHKGRACKDRTASLC